jgi:hypothetical protein|eukprot:g4623.t1
MSGVLDSIDVLACLRMGATGALGAVPGTLCAHPCDVVKIKMQIGGASNYAAAFKDIVKTPNPKTGKALGVFGFYRGLTPAIEQRMVARGPMFLISELYTQIVEKTTGVTGTGARFIGSVGSGYTTGFLAGLAEYRKKMLSQSIVTAKEAQWGAIVRSAMRSGNGNSLLRRLHAAGSCSAVYDSTFFASQYHLQHERGFSAPASFGSAAAAAVTVAFVFDTTVARMMVVAPDQPVKSFFGHIRELVWNGAKPVVGDSAVMRCLRGVRVGFRGLPARIVEFGISYTVTGMVSVVVAKYFVDKVTESEASKNNDDGE